MRLKKQKSNILQYHRKKHLNIGIIIFGIIFIYLVATIVMYLTAPRITVYEVREGSILKDHAYTGVAIRKETVVFSDDNGYINYFVQSNSKVRAGADIYTLSDHELNFDVNHSEEEIVITEEKQSFILLKLQTFCANFDKSSFSETYQIKNEIEGALQNLSTQSKLTQLHTMLSQENLSLHKTSEDGVIIYCIDGMESLTVDTITVKDLDKSNYHRNELTNNSRIDHGKPVYKLVTEEDWNIVIEISKETASLLEEKKSIKVRFKKDNQLLRASFTVKEEEGRYLAYLSFDTSMIRYANERYLDIELILEDESGLKIPKTAKTTKSFYLVPNSYITQGGNNSSNGVLRQMKNLDGNTITEFINVEIYYEENEMVYLDPNDFHPDDVLVKPDSTETYSLAETKELVGVYCINKGYAMFKQIHILCESDDYYIIEKGSRYGISNFDHIALDSQNIKENDVVF